MRCWPRSAEHWRPPVRFAWAAALACGVAAAPAWGAGGAHVVDDASIEDPGTCHVETWTTRQDRHGGLLVAVPACTPKALPRLEIGGFIVHGWAPGDRATSVGLAGKLNLRQEETGVGIAIDGSLGYSADCSRIETASVIVPVTIPLNGKIHLNLDAGWQWVRTGGTHDAFVGGQVEADIGRDFSLMGEMFTRTIDKPGGQVGLRWTPHQGKVDVDLVIGRYVDGVTPSAVTLGLTVRI